MPAGTDLALPPSGGAAPAPRRRVQRIVVTCAPDERARAKEGASVVGISGSWTSLVNGHSSWALWLYLLGSPGRRWASLVSVVGISCSWASLVVGRGLLKPRGLLCRSWAFVVVGRPPSFTEEDIKLHSRRAARALRCRWGSTARSSVTKHSPPWSSSPPITRRIRGSAAPSRVAAHA